MTDEQQEGWIRFGLLAICIIGAIVLELCGHSNAASWMIVPIIWIVVGII